jgi:hypothetical protein
MAEPRAATDRDLWQLLEPIHAVTYFSAEPIAALKEAGYRGFWMGYFAGRAAPLGPVSAEFVHAVFYNFTFGHVAKAIPDAWGFAAPSTALVARSQGSVAALRRLLGADADSADVARAAELAWRAAASAPLEGRPLYAANRALPAPDEPLALLWHAATLLREHRGDGHVATLAAHGIGGRESHVFHALSAGIPVVVYEVARNFDAEEWSSLVAGLQQRGLVDEAGAGLTGEGRALKQAIEATTDDLAAPAYSSLTDDELDELAAVLRPLTKAVIAGGDIPIKSPMGLDFSKPA